MHEMKNLILISISLFFFSSCSLFDREEDLPAFLHVAPFEFTTGEFEGSSSTNITEVKVTLNGNSLGLFELPATIPVLEKGTQSIILSPVVKQNGISTTRVTYPLYKGFSSDEVFSPLDTTFVSPSSSYIDNLIFWIEDFDNSVSFEEIESSQGELVRVTADDLTFEEQGSAFFELEPDAEFFYTETDEGFFLPTGTAVFLEFDYSCTHPFVVGIKSRIGISETSADLIGISATTSGDQSWKKIYINLTDYVADNSSANSFDIYYKMDRSDLFPEPLIYLDNVKIIF